MFFYVNAAQKSQLSLTGGSITPSIVVYYNSEGSGEGKKIRGSYPFPVNTTNQNRNLG